MNSQSNVSVFFTVTAILLLALAPIATFAAADHPRLLSANMTADVIERTDNKGNYKVRSSELDSLLKCPCVKGLIVRFPEIVSETTTYESKYGYFRLPDLSTCYEIWLGDISNAEITAFGNSLTAIDGINNVQISNSGIPLFNPNDPCYNNPGAGDHFDGQWFHRAGELYGINTELAWELTQGNSNVGLGHVDWDMILQHLDNEIAPSRIVPGSISSDVENIFWGSHGYQTLGVLAAAGNNNQVTAGINWNSDVYHTTCEWTFDLSVPDNIWDILSNLSNLNDLITLYSGVGATGEHVFDMVDALNTNGRPFVTSNSYGFWGHTNAMYASYLYAYLNNGLNFCAIGQGDDYYDLFHLLDEIIHFEPYPEYQIVYPARYAEFGFTAAVGGIKRDPLAGHPDPFGYDVDYKTITAPADMIKIHNDDGGETQNLAEGTSFSTPMAAGAASLIWSLQPNLDNDDVLELMKLSAKELDNYYGEGWGAGLLDVYTALSYASYKCVSHHFTTTAGATHSDMGYIQRGISGDYREIKKHQLYKYVDPPTGLTDPDWEVYGRSNASVDFDDNDGDNDRYGRPNLTWPWPYTTDIPFAGAFKLNNQIRLHTYWYDGYRFYYPHWHKTFQRPRQGVNVTDELPLAYGIISNDYIQGQEPDGTIINHYVWRNVVNMMESVNVCNGVTLEIADNTVIYVSSDTDVEINVQPGGGLIIGRNVTILPGWVPNPNWNGNFASQEQPFNAAQGTIELNNLWWTGDVPPGNYEWGGIGKTVYLGGGSISIHPDATVTILPGTTVIVNQEDFDLGIYANGALIAEGTEDNPIVFETTNRGKDVKIYLQNANCSIRYCDFYTWDTTDIPYPTIRVNEHLSAATREIYGCTFTNSSCGVYIDADDNNGSADVVNCEFSVLGEPQFQYPQEGIYVNRANNVRITGNRFTKVSRPVSFRYTDQSSIQFNKFNMTDSDYDNAFPQQVEDIRPCAINLFCCDGIDVSNNRIWSDHFVQPFDPYIKELNSNGIRIKNSWADIYANRIGDSKSVDPEDDYPLGGHPEDVDSPVSWYAIVNSGGCPRMFSNYIRDARIGLYEHNDGNAILRANLQVSLPPQYVGNDFDMPHDWHCYNYQNNGWLPDIQFGFNSFKPDGPSYSRRCVKLWESNGLWPENNDNFSVQGNYWGSRTGQALDEAVNFNYDSQDEIWCPGYIRTNVDYGDCQYHTDTFDPTPSSQDLDDSSSDPSYELMSITPVEPGDLPPALQYIDQAEMLMKSGDYLSAAAQLQNAVTAGTDDDICRAYQHLTTCQRNISLKDLDLTDYFSKAFASSGKSRSRAIAAHGLAQIYVNEGDYAAAHNVYASVVKDSDFSLRERISAKVYSGFAYIDEAAKIPGYENDFDYSERLKLLTPYGDPTLLPESLSNLNFRAQQMHSEAYPITPAPVVNSNTVWDLPDMYLPENITVEAGHTLTITPGSWIAGDDVTINVFGKIVCVGSKNAPIRFSPVNREGHTGVDIVLHPGSSAESRIEHCIFEQSNKAITISTQLSHPIQQVDFLNCNFAAYLPEKIDSPVYFQECRFNTDTSFRDVGICLIYPSMNSKISDCSFIGAFSAPITIVKGFATIENCIFDNSDFLKTKDDIAAIDLTTSEATIDHCTIYRYPTGIRLYDTDITLQRTRIEHCFNEGLWILHDSHVTMSDIYGTMNWFQNNGSCDLVPAQIRIEGKVYPYMRGGKNNIWQADKGYAIVTTSDPAKVELWDNYWGTIAPSDENLFNPCSSDIIWKPFLTSKQVPTGGYLTASEDSVMFDESIRLMREGEYSQAADLFKLVALNDSTTTLRIGAVSRLLSCYLADENLLSTELHSFYDELLDSTNDDRVRMETGHCKAQLQCTDGLYDEAIAYYESVLTNPETTYEDSLYAIIDLGNVYLESGQESSGNISSANEWFPLNVVEHVQHVSEIQTELRDHRGNTTSAKNCLPTRFALQPAYPNPFNPSLTIPFAIPERTKVMLKIYNILGREVTTLMNEDIEPGFHSVHWNAHNMSSGIYFVKLSAGNKNMVQKVMLMR